MQHCACAHRVLCCSCILSPQKNTIRINNVLSVQCRSQIDDLKTLNKIIFVLLSELMTNRGLNFHQRQRSLALILALARKLALQRQQILLALVANSNFSATNEQQSTAPRTRTRRRAQPRRADGTNNLIHLRFGTPSNNLNSNCQSGSMEVTFVVCVVWRFCCLRPFIIAEDRRFVEVIEIADEKLHVVSANKEYFDKTV